MAGVVTREEALRIAQSFDDEAVNGLTEFIETGATCCAGGEIDAVADVEDLMAGYAEAGEHDLVAELGDLLAYLALHAGS